MPSLKTVLIIGAVICLGLGGFKTWEFYRAPRADAVVVKAWEGQFWDGRAKQYRTQHCYTLAFMVAAEQPMAVAQPATAVAQPATAVAQPATTVAQPATAARQVTADTCGPELLTSGRTVVTYSMGEPSNAEIFSLVTLGQRLLFWCALPLVAWLFLIWWGYGDFVEFLDDKGFFARKKNAELAKQGQPKKKPKKQPIGMYRVRWDSNLDLGDLFGEDGLMAHMPKGIDSLNGVETHEDWSEIGILIYAPLEPGEALQTQILKAIEDAGLESPIKFKFEPKTAVA